MPLPQINTSGYIFNNELSTYYVIDSEWNELNENGEFKSPTTPGCTYWKVEHNLYKHVVIFD